MWADYFPLEVAIPAGLYVFGWALWALAMYKLDDAAKEK